VLRIAVVRMISKLGDGRSWVVFDLILGRECLSFIFAMYFLATSSIRFISSSGRLSHSLCYFGAFLGCIYDGVLVTRYLR
jgi:hypothetical protein